MRRGGASNKVLFVKVFALVSVATIVISIIVMNMNSDSRGTVMEGDDGCIYVLDNDRLIIYPGDKSSNISSLNKGVLHLKDHSYDLKNVSTLIISEGIESIGDHSFSGCPIKEIVICKTDKPFSAGKDSFSLPFYNLKHDKITDYSELNGHKYRLDIDNDCYRQYVTVIFDSNGAGIPNTECNMDTYSTITNVPSPTCDGKRFCGWYSDSACTKEWDQTEIITSDCTLYAKWAVIGADKELEKNIILIGSVSIIFLTALASAFVIESLKSSDFLNNDEKRQSP